MAEFGAAWGKNMTDSGRQRYLDSMMKGIMEMGMEGENSDVEVIVEGHSFPCHKLLLSAGSPYFKAMFSSGMTESTSKTLELPDIEKSTFEAFRSYLYTGQENITQDNVVQLLRAAAIFQVQALQESCEQFLGKEMDNENCLELFKISRSYGCKSLFDKCRPYVLEGFNGLWQTQEFEELALDEVVSIVKDDDLVPIDEEQICEAVIRWVKADLENREKLIGKLFRYIRLIRISPEFLINNLFTEDLCTKNEDCQRYLKEARNYHMLPARQQEFCSPRFHLRNSDDLEEVVLVITEFDMEKSGNFFQDGKCLWAYSFQQMRWYTLSPIPMKENPGQDFETVSFCNDLYLAGGTINSKNLLHYDCHRNEWTLCETQMKRGRSCHAMAAVRETIYVLGGRNPKGRANSNILGSIEAYGIRNRKWEAVGELALPVYSSSWIVIGEKIYLFGGLKEKGKHAREIQVFDTRKRESKIVGKLPKEITQPLKMTSFLNMNVTLAQDGKLYELTVTQKAEEQEDFRFRPIQGTISKSLQPVLSITHYRGFLVLLSANHKKPDVFSQMTMLDATQSPHSAKSVTPSSKNSSMPKPIHSCQRGIIDKQYLYHNYYQ